MDTLPETNTHRKKWMVENQLSIFEKASWQLRTVSFRECTWMSQEVCEWLGSMGYNLLVLVKKWCIFSLSEWNPEIKVWIWFSLLKICNPKKLKPFSHWPSKYWGYIPLILTFHQHFHRDIQAGLDFLHPLHFFLPLRVFPYGSTVFSSTRF